MDYLFKLKRKADGLGVPTSFVSQNERERLEPHVRASAALSSPTTGIVDSHAFVSFLEQEVTSGGGDIATRSKVIGVEWKEDEMLYRVRIQAPHREEIILVARTVVNAAGLWADNVAESLYKLEAPELGSSSARMIGLPQPFLDTYKIHPCQGGYYSLSASHSDGKLASRLIYPVPDPHLTSLGIHLTVDLAGKIKFGPDVHYVESKVDYDLGTEGSKIELERREVFLRAVQRYLHPVAIDQLQPDYAGIRYASVSFACS
jgi:2-hydroxyglutarate dehydrogenase